MNRKLTLTVELTVDHLNALAAMVELGADDRRDFLTRYATENDWTDAQIADGHHEADCAEDAVNRLTAAAEQQTDHPDSD